MKMTLMEGIELQELFYRSAAAHHGHTCPRQVLGVRMGLYAGKILGLEVPQKRHYYVPIL
jgi:formylmethanofuran dehydrogenase subunit E